MDDFDPYGDGDVPEHGCMANVLLRSDWFRTHTDVRFARHLGETGGEDMMFLDLAAARGAANGVVVVRSGRRAARPGSTVAPVHVVPGVLVGQQQRARQPPDRMEHPRAADPAPCPTRC